MKKHIISLGMTGLLVCTATCPALAANLESISTEPNQVVFSSGDIVTNGVDNSIKVLEQTPVSYALNQTTPRSGDGGVIGDGTEETIDGSDIETGIRPRARGSLSPYASYAFDSQSLYEGESITISSTWTPTSSKIRLGVRNDNNGIVTYKTVSGGSASASFKVVTSGKYSIYVYNPSTSDIDFSVSYIIS